MGVGRAIVDQLVTEATSSADSGCARSRTSRATSCGSGSRSSRTSGCARRCSPTASAARSSARAASTRCSLRARRATQRSPAGRARTGVATPDSIRPSGRHHGRGAGFRAAGVSAGIKASGAPRPRAHRRRPPVPAAALFTTNQVQAAPVTVSREHLRRPAARRGRARQQRVRQRVHGGRRPPRRTGVDGRGRPPRSAARRARARRLHRRHWRRPAARQAVAAGIAAAAGALAPTGIRPRAAIMTTDLGPKEARGARRDRRRRVPRRRHREGRRHDRADARDDARRSSRPMRRSTPPLLAARARRGGRSDVQRHHRRRRVLHERHAWRCSRAARAASTIDEVEHYGALVDGLTAVCRDAGADDRPRRRGRDQARGDAGHRRGDRRRSAAGGEDDRELAAREDRRARRRSELGPPGRGGRTIGRAASTSTRARSQSGRSCCSGTGSRSTRARRTPPSYLQGADIDIHVDMGAGGAHEATVWTCDLSAEYVRINGEYRT